MAVRDSQFVSGKSKGGKGPKWLIPAKRGLAELRDPRPREDFAHSNDFLPLAVKMRGTKRESVQKSPLTLPTRTQEFGQMCILKIPT